MIPQKTKNIYPAILGLAALIAGLLLTITFVQKDDLNASIFSNITGFGPLDKNVNVGEQIQLTYFSQGVQTSGQWSSLAPEVLESLGGGLFRAKAEGYARVRIVPQNDDATETFVGVVDPSKTPNSSFEVSLVQRTPIYSATAAEYFGYHAFENIDFIPGAGGGNFAIVGECADGRDASFGVLGFSYRSELEGGGLYILNENGQFVAKGDVCKDTRSVTVCYEGGGCMTGDDISPAGNDRFLLDTGNGGPNSEYRSPLLYSISGSGVSRENRLFFTNLSDEVDPASEKAVIKFSNLAYANGVMVGIGTETTGRPPQRISGFPGASSLERKNIFYSVPEFQRLGDISQPQSCAVRSCSGSPELTQEVYKPLFGSGEYFVAAKSEISSAGGVHPTSLPYEVYRMPSADALRAGQRPQKIQALDLGFTHVVHITRDALNPNRVMVVGLGGSGNSQPYVIYEPGPSGLTATGRGVLNTVFSATHNTALRGEYIAYTSCANPSSSVIEPFPGITGACQLVVEKNGQPLAVEPLPLNWGGRGAGAVAISPSGNILAAFANETGIFAEIANIYLYHVNGIDGVTPPPPAGNPENAGSPEENGNQNQRTLCQQAGGIACTTSVNPGEIQFGARGANGCAENFCVACAQGYTWSGGALGNCQNTASCTDPAVGGNGCTFTVNVGERLLGGNGAYGCTGLKTYCVQCASGYIWNGANCVAAAS